MATIGTFKKTAANEYTGDIVTLGVQARGVRIVPDLRTSGENAPSHRILVGRAEIGAAWSRRSTEGLRLPGPQDRRSELHRADPRQPHRRRRRRGDGHSLIWSHAPRRGD